jgi:hypothetical protein
MTRCAAPSLGPIGRAPLPARQSRSQGIHAALRSALICNNWCSAVDMTCSYHIRPWAVLGRQARAVESCCSAIIYPKRPINVARSAPIRSVLTA